MSILYSIIKVQTIRYFIERLHLKAGLVDCGVEHECHYYNGKWCDTIHMEILKADWLDKQKEVR